MLFLIAKAAVMECYKNLRRNNDQMLISSNITSESNKKVMRIRQLITEGEGFV